MDARQEINNPKEIARKIEEEGMHCNCDLDNWEPSSATEHTWVCRIHKKAMEIYKQRR